MKPTATGSWTQATAEAPWDVRNLPNCVAFDEKMWIMAGGSYVGNVIGNEQIGYNDVWSSTDGANWELVPCLKSMLVLRRRFIPSCGVALARHIPPICLARAPCRTRPAQWAGDSTTQFYNPTSETRH